MQKYTRFNAQFFQDAMICNMDSIGKYMLEIILHQQRTPQLLKQKKLMQTQGDYSNTVQALSVDSLIVDLVIIQNTCSEKEDSNSETASNKSVKESSLDSATKDVHAIKYKMSKVKERCMAYFRSLYSHVLSKEDLKGTHIEHGFKRAFMSLFGQDDDTFTSTMSLNVDQLQKQLDKDDFQTNGSMAAFWVVNSRFQKLIDSQFSLDYDSQMIEKCFAEYTRIEVKQFRDTLLQHMGNVKKSVAERTRHQRQYDIRVNKRQMQTQESKIDMGKVVDANLVVTESSGTESEAQDDSSRSKNDTNADDADIKPIYDEEPMAEVQLTAECNIFATGQQHTEQTEIIDEDNEHLNKENETVKKHYIDLYDSIKITRSKTIEHTTSLLANNADLKSSDSRKVLQSLRNQSVVRQPNAFKSERHQTSKPRFASQVDLKNDLSKPVTQHYLPKRRESAFAKHDQVIASSESKNSSKNMPRFSSNDMVHYLKEAMKKTQERNRNSKSSVMHAASTQNTTKASKPKSRSNNQTSRSLPVSKSSCVTITTVPIADHFKNSNYLSYFKHFVCSTCHKFVFNANHDACITKILKEVNSRAKFQSNKTRNSNKPVEHKSHTQKLVRQIFTGHGFSLNKTYVVYEITSPRSYLRWKPMVEFLKLLVLDLIVMTPMIEFGSILSPLFDEYFNGENQVVSKSSAVTTADASDKRQQQPDSTSSTSTLATSVTADGNFDF
ncbi:hypothetical protein Tco_0488688 [Tanacetum coccineum]